MEEGSNYLYIFYLNKIKVIEIEKEKEMVLF